MNKANEFYADVGQEILRDGFLVNTRGTTSREILCSAAQFDLNEPLVVTLASRKLKPSYVIDEFNWYMSGSLLADDISGSAPFWDKLKDEDGDVVSNYGYWLFHDDSFYDSGLDAYVSRFDNCVNILVADTSSRKAVINIHGVDNSDINPKDTPCTLSLQFLIREDTLHMIVNMRSNDLVMGWCNDVLQFQFIAWMMYSVLKHRYEFHDLKLGNYMHIAGSLHIYDRHFDKPEFHGVETDLHSPAAIHLEYSLQQALRHISVNQFANDSSLTNLEWLLALIVPNIVKRITRETIKEEIPSLLEFGALPLDEGI